MVMNQKMMCALDNDNKSLVYKKYFEKWVSEVASIGIYISFILSYHKNVRQPNNTGKIQNEGSLKHRKLH